MGKKAGRNDASYRPSSGNAWHIAYFCRIARLRKWMKSKKLKELYSELKKETLSRKSPHEIALGIGAGAFLGVLPLQGFKTALVVLVGGLYKKVNIIAIFTASTVFSLIPVVPFVYFFDYWIGAKILGVTTIFTVSSFKEIDFRMLGSAAGSLFLGGVVVGITLGTIAYYVSISILKLKNRKSR